MAKEKNQNKPISLLQSNEYFVNKILSRNSSLGHSTRLSSYRLPGQVPFKWETQPGKPKAQFSANRSPTITLPPPESPIRELSKPYIVITKNQPPAPVRVWFWKKSKKKYMNNVKKNDLFGSARTRKDVKNTSMENEGGELSMSCVSYSLSTSFSSASSNRYGRKQSKFSSLAKEFIRWVF